MIEYLDSQGVKQNITETRYAELRAKLDRFNLWLGNRTSYMPDEVPLDCRITNEDRSAIEVYEFCVDPPERYTTYVKLREQPSNGSFPLSGAKVTTWTGDVLGNAILGTSYRDNFGGLRHSVYVKAINGKEYFGTYYRSAGDYCQLKMTKASRKAS